ncbi:MAG TPA: TetR family transcriptional regulator [Thermoanaerobaculia bacterium]|nr:TetR family transcriptional regulator [Thermoanaerobaculia bacterium]
MADRRIQKTRMSLHEALMALVLEMPYADITVQQVLDRANVGRSTFYTHFQDKDELLMWGTEHLKATLAAAASPDDIVGFSQAMFEHAHGYRKVYRALVNSPVWPHLRQRIHNIVAEQIRRDSAAALRRLPRSKSKLPAELFVHYLAATLMAVLTWWIDHNSSLSAAEIDHVFRGLVQPAIRSVLA